MMLDRTLLALVRFVLLPILVVTAIVGVLRDQPGMILVSALAFCGGLAVERMFRRSIEAAGQSS